MSNWIQPTGSMLPQVIQLAVLNKSNENIDANSISTSQQPQNSSTPIPFDDTLEDRADDLVQLVVKQVRGAIQIAGRQPLSVTPAAVPPEALDHVLNVVAWQLICSTPNLQMVIITEKGMAAPFQNFWRDGVAYIKSLAKGQGIVPPSDPTGIDYLTAVDPNTNPPVSAILSAPIVGEIDLSTDNALGGRVSGGTVPPNGVQQGTIGDVYIQRDATGVIIKTWVKTYGPATDTGWI